MRKYIFAFDLDGTLLMDNGLPNSETLEAMKKAQEKGHILTIATGRSVKNTKSLLKIIPYIDYFVCNNGAITFDVKNDKPLTAYSVNPQHYIFMHDFAKQNDGIFKMHTDKDWIGYKQYEKENPTLLTPEFDEQVKKHIIENPNDDKLFNGQIITQLSIYKSGDFCKNNYEFVKSKVSNDSSVFLANSVYIDVNPKNRSKWEGLKELGTILNIPISNIVTFGDSGNDCEMIVNAGINGYAMQNSHPDLLEQVKPRLGNNNSNTIGLKILEYIENL